MLWGKTKPTAVPSLPQRLNLKDYKNKLRFPSEQSMLKTQHQILAWDKMIKKSCSSFSVFFFKTCWPKVICFLSNKETMPNSETEMSLT